MRFQRTLNWLVLIVYGIGTLSLPQPVRAEQSHLAPANAVSAFDLIIAMNTLRVSYGLPALVEDPIIDAVAQSTAATMAANNMSWHIGNVRGRLASAGSGNGDRFGQLKISLLVVGTWASMNLLPNGR